MLLSTLLVFCLVSFSRATGPVVMTSKGLVKGFVDHLKESTYIGVDSDFDVFFGIPFAKPPVGDLRFANPERPDPWVDTYDATTVRALCPQPMVGTKDEDCLYLNVYAPNPTPDNAAVMVWFHGGAYNAGTAGRYMFSGIPLAAVGNVIVVTANYRLGSLGFLSTGTYMCRDLRYCKRYTMLLSTLLVFCLVSFSRATGPVVMTSKGLVKGFVDHLKESTYIGVDSDFDVFFGIPFAKPPVGDLRFANPERPDPWVDTYDATTVRALCPQPMVGTKDEDCLYLNVYAPNPTPDNAAVMVWFHGGAYNAGTAGRYMFSGIPLAAVGNVIVVTANYRLGSLGFLSTGDAAAPGNYGSFDQVMALRWVQENIASFGGDPTRVTIFGESAGATSVGLHVVSKESEDLFTWAIMQSGSTMTPFAYNPDLNAAREDAFKLGSNVGCDEADSNDLIACLRTKSASEVLAGGLQDQVCQRGPGWWTPAGYIRVTFKFEMTDSYDLVIACLRTKSASEVLAGGLRFGFLSAPVVDGRFLITDPVQMLAKGDFKHRNILLGSNHDEGTLWALGIYPDYTLSKSAPYMSRADYDEHRDDFLTGSLNDIALKAMDQQYIDWSSADNLDTDYLDLLVRQITDETFTAPADATARAFYQHGAGDVYMYELTHVPSVPAYSLNLLGPGWLGVTHGEDLQFVFGWSFVPQITDKRRNLRSNELTFMVNLMTYWTNFANTG
eukprot:XP_011674807.1 PREDICTED: cholinesterase [Strongylocentrotus purpuratus]